jgi:hypothetical protein
MLFSNLLKNIIGIFCIAFLFNTQVVAQVSSNRMTCFDSVSNIGFNVHFQDSVVILELKGHTYRILYNNSYVSRRGERWSEYVNREIRVSTTLPYDKWVALWTVSSNENIAATYCK